VITALWTGGLLLAIALYLVAASRIGKRMARNSQRYPATPPMGDGR
jgi:hypothetical protein